MLPDCYWRYTRSCDGRRRDAMNSIIYIVGLVVVVVFILSVLGLA